MTKSNNKMNPIQTMADAEQAMSRMDEIDRTLGVHHLAEEEEIARIKNQYAQDALEAGHASLQEERKLLAKQMETFARQDRENWNGRQTQETKWGKFGFHAGQPKVEIIKSKSKTFAKALEKMTKLKWAEPYLRKVAEINKELILQDHALYSKDPEEKKEFKEELAQAGLKVHKKESFSVTTSAAESLERQLKELR